MIHNEQTKPTPTYDSLTVKQQAFIHYYIQLGFNATLAAKKAGYSKKTAGSIGNENLTKPAILKAIKEILSNVHIDTNEILQRYIQIATFNPSDYLITEYDNTSKPTHIGIDVAKLKADGYGFMVKGIKYGKYGQAEIELLDREKALDNLAKISGLFSGKGDNPINIITKVVPSEDFDKL